MEKANKCQFPYIVGERKNKDKPGPTLTDERRKEIRELAVELMGETAYKKLFNGGKPN